MTDVVLATLIVRCCAVLLVGAVVGKILLIWDPLDENDDE